MLQIVNITKDIVKDSKTLGRCYIPSTFLEDSNQDLHQLTIARNPEALGSDKLARYAGKMLKLVEIHDEKSKAAVNLFPKDSRAPLLALLYTYRTIGQMVVKKSNYKWNVSQSKVTKIGKAISCLYGFA